MGEKGEIMRLVAHYGRDNLFGVWALDREWIDVGFGYLDVEPQPDGEPEGIEPQVSIGDGQPDPILREAQQQRVVEQRTVGVDDGNVPAAADRESTEIAWRE